MLLRYINKYKSLVHIHHLSLMIILHQSLNCFQRRHHSPFTGIHFHFHSHHPGAIREETVLHHRHDCLYITGRGGESLKQITRTTGAKVDCSKEKVHGPWAKAKVTITGTRQEVKRAQVRLDALV